MLPLFKQTKNIILIVSFLVALTNVNAQIKVFPSEDVQIGPLWWPTFPSTKKLFVNGGIEVREHPGSGMYIQNYNNIYNGVMYDDPSIVSHFNYGGWVGTPNQAMFAVYTNQLFVQGIQITSDEKLKKNIQTISSSSALLKIKSIKSYTYEFNDSAYKNCDKRKLSALKDIGKNQIGFKAQELRTIVPEAVKLNPDSSTYSVNYVMIIPLLVEAIKEQQKLIDSLTVRMNTIGK